jgi:predicted nuclease of restriction endonuclease-like (RecB) superfamily
MARKEILQPLVGEMPAGYKTLLKDLKQRIKRAQIKASLAANSELIRLYWDIGKTIVERQEKERWGRSVVERLSKDLRQEFPEIKGFSARNIWKMRAFYCAWSRRISILPQPAAELDGENLPQVATEIPWDHNVTLVSKIKDPSERLWYAWQTLEHGWSRSVLVMHIESGLYKRQGKAITNFERTLPPPQSDLAQQTVKDPYVFDFLTMSDKAHERDIEMGLVDHVRRFLLELGDGFAFVGQQYPLEVGGENFYIDLLFYHIKLRCYVVIELKAQPFKPEHAGKMNFYLSAADDLLRHGDDQPSIGLILCKDKNKIVAEYAIRDIKKPIGVSQWKTKIVESLPKRLHGKLPSVQELEEELS